MIYLLERGVLVATRVLASDCTLVKYLAMGFGEVFGNGLISMRHMTLNFLACE